jgi:hypothetical protein
VGKILSEKYQSDPWRGRDINSIDLYQFLFCYHTQHMANVKQINTETQKNGKLERHTSYGIIPNTLFTISI